MPKLTIFITCFFWGVATHPSFADTFIPNPSNCEASQFRFVGMTPDNETLVASSSHEVVIINVESGEALFHSRYRGNVFEPHGLSSDGRFLIGGG